MKNTGVHPSLGWSPVFAEQVPDLQTVNCSARQEYLSEAGFTKLGMHPGGFCNRQGIYEDIILHYIPRI